MVLRLSCVSEVWSADRKCFLTSEETRHCFSLGVRGSFGRGLRCCLFFSGSLLFRFLLSLRRLPLCFLLSRLGSSVHLGLRLCEACPQLSVRLNVAQEMDTQLGIEFRWRSRNAEWRRECCVLSLAGPLRNNVYTNCVVVQTSDRDHHRSIGENWHEFYKHVSSYPLIVGNERIDSIATLRAREGKYPVLQLRNVDDAPITALPGGRRHGNVVERYLFLAN